MTETVEADKAAAEGRVLDIADRLDRVIVAAKSVLPPPQPEFDEDRVIALFSVKDGFATEVVRLLTRIEPLVRFCELELLPAIADGANDLATISDRKPLQREEPKTENKVLPEEPKSELPKAEPSDRKEKKTK